MDTRIRQDKCPFCESYESLRQQATTEEMFRTTFWCALRIKKFRWKDTTDSAPLYSLTTCEYRLHYCPRCGKQLITLRHRDSKNGKIKK